MSYCSKCGAQVNDDATYCHKCGSPLENNSPGGQNPWYIKPVEPTRNNNGMNRFAILGFIFSMCSFFISPALGLVFSIIGLIQTKKNKARGKGFAIAGIIVSGIAMLINLVMVVYILLHPELLDSFLNGIGGSSGSFGGFGGGYNGYYGT